MTRFRMTLLAGVLMLTPAPFARAVLSGDSPPPPEASAADADYSAGLIAWENGHWEEVIARMTRVIERRPWHDNAHNLLGYAHRRQGNFQQSLEHYRTALELNPHHRGALEYLGETHLEMGNLAQARAILRRLEGECRIMDLDPVDCEEWRLLKAAVDEYVQTWISEPVADPHGGQFKTLHQVLVHYNTAPSAPTGHSELVPLGLSARELEALEAFLHALSGPPDKTSWWSIPPPAPELGIRSAP